MEEVFIYTDGGSRGNPGPAAIGGIIVDGNGNIVSSYSEYIGVQTNNFAEYRSMIKALSVALEAGVKNVSVFSDSELLVKQIKGEYKVKSENLREMFLSLTNLIEKFDKFRITHSKRSDTKIPKADSLVNKALDAGIRGVLSKDG